MQRQRQKLLPVEYFMVTFTLPAQLRALAWQHQRQVYDLLFRTAADTLKQFGANDKKLDADLGMTGVLHTHSRRLDYHPHIHFVVPGGGINTRRKEWRKLTGHYLFNGKNLAMVFRARLLRALDEQGLLSLSLKTRLPKEWVVNCKRVGKGLPALEYLSRYLYRGVISDNNILASKQGKVTFSYLNSETGKKETRTLPGEDFLWLVLKHVLPRRFRRLRDYGFLHSNAKKQLSLVQLVFTRHGQSSRTRDSSAIQMQALRRSDEAHCVQLPETDLSCHSNKYRHSQTGRRCKLSQTDMTYPRLP
ncbi:IS91 family transposase [Endozoicomonas sp. ALB091]|uniref:IS91 family transposase n=1 Tax=Endozoicomonas sp. ALB091 TaxID=3403073 RepID=UPI003BB5977C